MLIILLIILTIPFSSQVTRWEIRNCSCWRTGTRISTTSKESLRSSQSLRHLPVSSTNTIHPVRIKKPVNEREREGWRGIWTDLVCLTSLLSETRHDCRRLCDGRRGKRWKNYKERDRREGEGRERERDGGVYELTSCVYMNLPRVFNFIAVRNSSRLPKTLWWKKRKTVKEE